MLQNTSLSLNSKTLQPKVIIIRRRPNQGFGFTLRHFIAYPPEDDPAWLQSNANKDGYITKAKAMETIFIKEVQPNGPAHHANLQTGDRVLMVNNIPIAGIAYCTIVSMIKQTNTVLTLHVVPKECDVLQMHYTTIAHTPESNRGLLAMPQMPTAKLQVNSANSNGSLKASDPFIQQNISIPGCSVASANCSEHISGNLCYSGESKSIVTKSGVTSCSFDFDDEVQKVHHYPTDSTLLMRSDISCVCSQSLNAPVIQKKQQYQNSNISSTPAVGNNDLMLRLRESIKQKEEFLKSPLPRASQQQQLQQQHFFASTPPSGSPQLSMGSSSITSAGSSSFISGSRGQIRALGKLPLSDSNTNSLTSSNVSNLKDLFTNSCDMNNLYSRNPNECYDSSGFKHRSESSTHEIIKRQPNKNSNNITLSPVNAKCSRDFDYLETIQDTGVTNKVFERKLVSHIAKGFDPFKPLSINTNPTQPSIASSNNVTAKKQNVLYDSLQHHPLHQQQLKQLHNPQQKLKHNTVINNNGVDILDVQQSSRMETHKASLAITSMEYTQSTFSNNLPCSSEKSNLPDISEHNNMRSVKEVVRRFKPTSSSSFDDSKPMRRISYLRATNNESDFLHSDTSATSATTLTTASAVPLCSTNVNEMNAQTEDTSEPIYDVVACGHEFVETASGIEEAKLIKINKFSSKYEGRSSSLSSDLRNSVLNENLELNGKLDTNDLAMEMEVFETEMEIKSSLINGKRISDFRSWRQVKIDIKGDLLRIYPNRSSKSENNIIEFKIKNYKFTDESIDKKKYMFRMQSKPIHLASLGNELNIDDVPDKLISSSNSGDTTDTSHIQTDILFKTKSGAEMKRILGLLQWKNSLVYDDDSEIGKQMAEPQKIAATSSISTPAYGDENLHLSSQQQNLLPAEFPPLVSTSRVELENSDAISPVMKARKSSSHKNIPDKDLGSPKSKNWKDLLFRRGGSASHSTDLSPSNLASGSKTIGSIGFPLKSCPMSKSNEYVPHIVDVCTNIVETKGLGVVGIYRIPGNKAAISELSEQVNKHDFSWDRCNTDVRWEDVNVVSSLLKLFIRSLPDALLPTSFYNHFIEADKKTGLERLKELKDLLESLPRHSYETMKHLIRHLNRVSKNCTINLMEPKNLAIIFGPSIIRTPNDTLEIAVKDMKHQCRIVELLVTQYEYFFENGEIPEIGSICGNNTAACASGSANSSSIPQDDQTHMLLHNVSKIERLTERETSRTSRFIPQLRRRTQNKRGAGSSDTYSGESVLSLDFIKSSTTHSSSGCSTNATAASSSGSSTTHFSKVSSSKKKERSGFLGARTHLRKASLDEKDSGSGSGTSSINKREQRSSIDISILLTDDESSNSRLSDTGSMSLTTITDTLDSKLRNLRSGSESNDEYDCTDFRKNRRHTVGQPLHLHSENIPYADESPERYYKNVNPLVDETYGLSRCCTVSNATTLKTSTDREKDQRAAPASIPSNYRGNKLQHSATVPINTSCSGVVDGVVITLPSTASSTSTTLVTVKTTTAPPSDCSSHTYTTKNLRFSSSVYEQCCSEDDSEGSTTSDPKESLVITSPTFFQDRYNKKRRDHKLFRSASFNCRNYSSRHNGATIGTGSASGLTKDEKTDMNLTKKRQIQNKQNRSIKRRHTVGGPHDYSSGNSANSCNNCYKKNASTTNVLQRIPIPSTASNVVINNNNNSSQQSDINVVSNSATLSVAGNGTDHVLEVGIRIKNINRNRY